MANFKVHVCGALIAGGAISGYGVTLGDISISNAIGVTLLCAFGGMLPDIDISNSKVSKIIFNLKFLTAV